MPDVLLSRNFLNFLKGFRCVLVDIDDEAQMEYLEQTRQFRDIRPSWRQALKQRHHFFSLLDARVLQQVWCFIQIVLPNHEIKH